MRNPTAEEVTESEEFKLPFWPLGVMVALLHGPIFLYGVALWWYAGFLWSIAPMAFGTVLVLFAFWSMRLSLRRDGMVLYQFNRLAWNDATDARMRRILGTPYLQVKRKRGMSYWIPLYFVGRRPLREALIELVPVGNPVRECLIGPSQSR